MRLDHLLSREQAEGKPEASSRSIASKDVLRSAKSAKENSLLFDRINCHPLDLYRFQGSEKNPGRRDPPRTLTTAQRKDMRKSLKTSCNRRKSIDRKIEAISLRSDADWKVSLKNL